MAEVDDTIDMVSESEGVYSVTMARGLEMDHPDGTSYDAATSVSSEWQVMPTKAKFITIQMKGTGRLKVDTDSLELQYHCPGGIISDTCPEAIYCDGHAKGNCP